MRLSPPVSIVIGLLLCLAGLALAQPLYQNNPRVNWPASGGALISAGPGNNNPTAIAEVDGSCLKGVSSAWAAAACGAGTVTTTGSPLSGELAKFSGASSITNGNLSGDVSTTDSLVTTIKADLGLAGNPTAATQAATDNSTRLASTAYVTTGIANAIAAVNPAVAVQAATTQASDTSSFVYLNGVGGIGATLTSPTTNTALTVDGYTFTALGQRLLVKNDTQSPSGAFNGVYYVTTLQAVAVKLVLTRALDYDQGSDINNTGAIPVVSGTANASTSWLLTSSVTTVGTDPLTFVQFSYAPSALARLGTAQSFTAGQRVTPSTLTISTATFTPSFDASNNFSLTLVHASCPCTLANSSTTPVAGQSGVFEIIQSSTGSDTIGTWGSNYTFAGGTSTITLSTGANARDYFSYYCADATHCVLSAGALNASH